MTYCLGMALNDGLVLASDSRTNAGVDHISTYRKMRIWQRQGERVLVLMSAGNLAITQAVAAVLENGVESHDPDNSIMIVDSAGQAARLVGDAVRKVHRRHGAALKEGGVDFNISLILGGQVKGEAPRLFLIYSAGNFIEAAPETPYFQIGETKYGKPILDRVITAGTDLNQAAKCALLSLDSTIRSNVTVGLPIDLLVYRRDSFTVDHHRLIQDDDSYFNDLRSRWGQGMKDLFGHLPDPPWEGNKA